MFQTKKPLTVENVLLEISPLNIFYRYCKNFKKVNSKFKSEFRKDSDPSAIIFQYGSTFLYKDFGEDGALNCFQYAQRKLELSFVDTLKYINEDFGLNLGYNTEININMPFFVSNNSIVAQKDYKTIIKIKRAEFTDENLIWWYRQAWNKQMLDLAKIYKISHFRLTSERKNIENKLFICDDNSYSMDYYWHNDVFRRKLYFPNKSSDKKWLSNVDSTIVQGWDLIKKSGDILFITSSFKDTAPFWQIYNHPVALAPNNEGSFIPNKVFYKLKQRFRNIIIYFDNDETGLKKARKFSQIYNIPYIHNPIGSPKDPTDFVKYYKNPNIGLSEWNYYLQKSLNNLNI